MDVQELRAKIRSGEYNTPTSGVASDKVQANLAILPREYAFDFLLFAIRNKKQVPIIDVLEPGQVESALAPGSDIRTDLPKYRIYSHGEHVDTVLSIKDYWQDDFVSFLIGCSFSFEDEILKAGIPIKHISQNKNVAMFNTNVSNKQAGVFAGNMVVSMRPFKVEDVETVSEITAAYPDMHGAPVQVGSPQHIGITDINRPDYGEFVEIDDGEIPVFWGCGVTPQNVAIEAKLPIMITHEPGHMFITDVNNAEYMAQIQQR